ncbi:hypothetical protein B484DRAFT_445761 [Ochromonadaceae sp. CCMP2298]|nr:hypothetical protein B484DRAFT_445761 [Ochromonadaceae sp. CCMP2298]
MAAMQCSRAWLCLLAVLSLQMMQVCGLKAVLLSRFSAVDSPQFRAMVGKLIRPEGVGTDVGVGDVRGVGVQEMGMQGIEGIQDIQGMGIQGVGVQGIQGVGVQGIQGVGAQGRCETR